MKGIKSKNIVFVTGVFLGNNGWDEWRNYFESRATTSLLHLVSNHFLWGQPGWKDDADYILTWLAD